MGNGAISMITIKKIGINGLARDYNAKIIIASVGRCELQKIKIIIKWKTKTGSSRFADRWLPAREMYRSIVARVT